MFASIETTLYEASSNFLSRFRHKLRGRIAVETKVDRTAYVRLKVTGWKSLTISINARIEVGFHGFGDGITEFFVQEIIVSQRDNFDLRLSLNRLAPT